MIPFKFYWGRLSLWAGVKFLIVMAILYLASKWIEFPWYLVGTSVLLTWLIVLLGKPNNKILIVFLYLVAGFLITWLNNLLFDTYWPWLIAIFIVTFLGTYLLKFGTQWYMIGWCLILWLYLMPILGQMGNPQELLISHVLGSSSVLILVILSVFWERSRKKMANEVVEIEQEEAKPMPEWWIMSYSTIVAVVMVFGLIVGHKYLSDPTMISNAAFMIIGFTGSAIIWKAGFERMIGAVLAVILGFYLGVLAQSEMLGIVILVTFYFLVLAFLLVNNGAVIFLFVFTISYSWGLQDFETGNALANERILSEFAGVILAGIAIFLLNLISKILNPPTD